MVYVIHDPMEITIAFERTELASMERSMARDGTKEFHAFIGNAIIASFTSQLKGKEDLYLCLGKDVGHKREPGKIVVYPDGGDDEHDFLVTMEMHGELARILCAKLSTSDNDALAMIIEAIADYQRHLLAPGDAKKLKPPESTCG